MANLFPTPFNTDLPEDWEQGQIVSPNGTEVGLSKQHGYNYLMQSVNALASGLNGVNTNSLLTSLGVIPVANGGTGSTNNYEAIRTLGNNSGIFLARTPERADDVSRDDINSLKMSGVLLTDGTNVANIPNFFDENGRKVITSFGVGNYNDYDGYIAFDHYSHEIAMRMGQAKEWERIVTDYNIAEMVQSALQSGGVSVVKSIQRGVLNLNTSQTEYTISISTINPLKAFVILNSSAVQSSSGSSRSNNYYLKSLTDTNIVVDASSSQNNEGYLSWQVIEYY